MKIEIKGPIINDADQWIYDWFGIPATSPSKVNSFIDRAIRNNDNELLVVINSGGGSVFSASEIYTSLKSFSGNVKIRIVGLAASAASVIAMSGYCEMAPTGQLMIHNASTSAWGDYNEMDYTSDFLQKTNQTIVNAYKIKTNKSDDELKAMMNKTTWMTAQEAKEFGFINAVMFENEYQAAASVEHPALVNGLLPAEVINKIREQLKGDPSNLVTNSTNTNESEESRMDLETLQNEHPELFKQIKNMGFTEGVKAENERIKAIEDMAPAGNDKMVYDAKFTSPVTAEKLAVQMVKAQKEAGVNYIQNAREDAQVLNNVKPAAAPETDNVTDEEKAAQALINIWGGQ
ncbi:head maturation protease, ClpP-related [Schinkia azotoformans]|uniref:head maturation protease, ClpP-related n=1 Tax=Schinkia azotoformans TaxID=1454 RepID=UPI002DBC24C0|nr:head maturation protease, ClpP-related [Schinkia azotoformans]MEC1744128.1 Clp protease ClpP [Schinkia azotoformans]